MINIDGLSVLLSSTDKVVFDINGAQIYLLVVVVVQFPGKHKTICISGRDRGVMKENDTHKFYCCCETEQTNFTSRMS